MKTKLLQAKSSTLKALGILVIALLSITNASSQTSIKSSQKNPVIIAIVHYQKAKSAVVPPKPQTFSVMCAKNFPIIESGEKFILNAMDDSENFNYEQLFCSKTITADKSVEVSSLVLNYKKQIINLF